LASRCDRNGVGLPGISAMVAAVRRVITSQSSQPAGIRMSRQITIASYEGNWYCQTNSQAMLSASAEKIAGCAVDRPGSRDSVTIASPTTTTVAIRAMCCMKKPYLACENSW
jgi:hypothetical protein